MADIKTHLRELSVATTIGLCLKGVQFNRSDLYDSQTFYNLASSVISTPIASASNILSIQKFEGEYRMIVDNGYKLGMAIYNNKHFVFTKEDKIAWTGNDTQKGDPIDIYVGKYGFSLKEESFILRNMGLYELLNCMTGSNYRRGLHVFLTFAPREYDSWFDYTWRSFVAFLRNGAWSLTKGNNISKAYINGSFVKMEFNKEVSSVPITIATTSAYMNATSAATREKVFSKWINEVFYYTVTLRVFL